MKGSFQIGSLFVKMYKLICRSLIKFVLTDTQNHLLIYKQLYQLSLERSLIFWFI